MRWRLCVWFVAMKMRSAGVLFPVLLLVATTIPAAIAILGIDFFEVVSEDQLSCVKSSGYDFAAVLGWHSYGSFEEDCVRSLRSMHRAGLSPADVYAVPCATMDGADQMDQLIADLRADNASYDTLWITIETASESSCAWPIEHTRNCKYLGAMIAEGQNSFKTVGVVTSEFAWGSVMGESCTVASSLGAPLWYSHFNRNPNFDDFRPFGGWDTPTAKQYATGSLCGITVNLSYAQNQTALLGKRITAPRVTTAATQSPLPPVTTAVV